MVRHVPRMQVVHDGPENASPLLLIHGSGASGATWAPMVGTLAGRHHVLRVDLPGCGQSSPAPTYDVPDQAAAIAALLDDLALRNVPVAGHSSGGWVAIALADKRPDLVGSLVLISTATGLDAQQPQPFILRALLAPPFGPLLWPLRSDSMIRKGIGATTARPVEIPDDAIADLKNITYRTFRKVLRCNGAYVAERSTPDRLADLDVPVLVIFGAADPRYYPESARQYEAVPNTRLEMLPGVGHIPMLEAPEATSELLLGFTAAAADSPTS
ncbi:pimeloyl-ACP methyl ester carboxylesterase [Kribbella amoyensis]|uniref:Pimeloyl-ACP methyl ester carboxylesterase n=1 Tax=Kribbella amoyensis TaxID=996641 RepID=A0A561B987_9ACTN|nr:alpha/beta hydrolase [Kribbella amoyensis]TWD75413.1 pimeloyl-ACP methyl ester carboxylesterase [Kribbella amoyensis]